MDMKTSPLALLKDPTLLKTDGLINGQWVPGSSRFDVLDPATGLKLADVANLGPADAEAAIAALLAVGLAAPASAQQVTTFNGPCDASAAVALDAAHFIVANDENNTLHVYRQDQPTPVASLNLANFLGTAADEESDIEGATVIGSRIYWITSHGRNSKGKERPARQRFFATDLIPGQPPTVKPVDRAYTDLLRDMLAAETLKPYRLGDAARLAAGICSGW